jgi:plastocyanin domain-containing protein
MVLASCKQDAKQAPPAPTAAPASPAVPTAVRTVAIEANEKGYVPDRITGKPGEQLKLKFTRTVEGECLSRIKTPDGTVIELPKGAPVEIDVAVPTTGEVKFACGMDMFFAVVVAEQP